MSDLKKCIASHKKPGVVTTCEGRLSYAQYLFRPNKESVTKDGKPKHTLSFLIPPGSDVSALEAIVQAAIDSKWPVGSKDRPRKPKLPLLDAGEKMGDEWEGWTLLRLSTTKKPAVVEADMSPADEADVYSGRWARVSVNAKDYDVDGNKGATLYLNNVQLLRHDDPIGGGASKAENDFEAIDVPASDTGSVFD